MSDGRDTQIRQLSLQQETRRVVQERGGVVQDSGTVGTTDRLPEAVVLTTGCTTHQRTPFLTTCIEYVYLCDSFYILFEAFFVCVRIFFWGKQRSLRRLTPLAFALKCFENNQISGLLQRVIYNSQFILVATKMFFFNIMYCF
eukprot:TRINITY_DN7890_c0_g1_i1.p4 TRINITY_DN7890_c0_g1~~TRINITY_DN7890_c0_g1_i1.p4  ORF type:complete len:143 (-),score=0.34 TRINITY_DN7890_c0_g1_i1:397-825(-)